MRAGLSLREEHEQRRQRELEALRAGIAAGLASGTPKAGDDLFDRLEDKYAAQAKTR